VTASDAAAPVDFHRLADLAAFEYRSLVVGRLRVMAEWRGLEWTDSAACTDVPAVTPSVCGRCSVVAECLAAAIVSDDPAEWRAGLSRTDREQLWVGLERTYRDLRDFDLMRLDVDVLIRRRTEAKRAPANLNGTRR
jgi:hypothetical protein